MLPFGTAVVLTLDRPGGEIEFTGEVCCLLASSRFAVQLSPAAAQFSALAVGQALTVNYVRSGEGKLVGETSVWSIDAEHAIVVLTPPETIGRHQHRRFVRVAHPVKVRVSVLDDHGETTWSGTTHATDLSAGGLCLGLPADLPLGTKLRCTFDVPARNATVPMEVLAVVVRNRDKSYGVKFSDMTPSMERHLVASVSWLEVRPRVGV